MSALYRFPKVPQGPLVGPSQHTCGRGRAHKNRHVSDQTDCSICLRFFACDIMTSCAEMFSEVDSPIPVAQPAGCAPARRLPSRCRDKADYNAALRPPPFSLICTTTPPRQAGHRYDRAVWYVLRRSDPRQLHARARHEPRPGFCLTSLSSQAKTIAVKNQTGHSISRAPPFTWSHTGSNNTHPSEGCSRVFCETVCTSRLHNSSLLPDNSTTPAPRKEFSVVT